MACNKKMSCVQRQVCESKKACGDESSDDCPIKMCNNCQCCICSSLCPVENNKLQIVIYSTNIKIKYATDQFILSDFVADRWQPPKTV